MTACLVDLGRMPYAEALEIQKQTLEAVIAGVLTNTLFFVEHDPVLTLGANFHEENLLLSKEEYAQRGVEVVRTERGGDVTYHGPRQLVMYPIFDTGRDLHKWLRAIEEVGIRVCAHYGLQGERLAVNTGVWVNQRKIAAIGIKVRRWISMHGMALNCDNDLTPYGWIVPCGVQGYGVTSLSQELGRPVTVDDAKPIAAQAFAQQFSLDWDRLSLAELRDRMG